MRFSDMSSGVSKNDGLEEMGVVGKWVRKGDRSRGLLVVYDHESDYSLGRTRGKFTWRYIRSLIAANRSHEVAQRLTCPQRRSGRLVAKKIPELSST